MQHPDPEFLRNAFGVSQLPRLLNPEQLSLAVRDAYPDELLGSGAAGSVLVRLSIDAEGAVVGAEAIEPPSLPGVQVRAVLTDPGTGRMAEVDPPRAPHLALARAAESAARVARFAPAEQDGRPVAFHDFRMTIAFAPPARS